MDARSTHRLRARIARLAHERPDLRPGEIARQLGCARSTVYKFLGAPGRDRRTVPSRRPVRTDPIVLAAVRRLDAADPSISAPALHATLVARAQLDPAFPPVPSVRTVRRLLLKLRADRGDPLLRPPPGRDEAASDDAVGGPDPDASPTAALRALLREVLDELDEHPRRSAARFRLRQQVIAVAAALARADYLRPARSAVTSALSRHLDVVADELLEAGAKPDPSVQVAVASPEHPSADPVADRPRSAGLSDGGEESAT